MSDIMKRELLAALNTKFDAQSKGDAQLKSLYGTSVPFKALVDALQAFADQDSPEPGIVVGWQSESAQRDGYDGGLEEVLHTVMGQTALERSTRKIKPRAGLVCSPITNFPEQHWVKIDCTCSIHTNIKKKGAPTSTVSYSVLQHLSDKQLADMLSGKSYIPDDDEDVAVGDLYEPEVWDQPEGK